MAIAIKLGSNGRLSQLSAADSLDINDIDARNSAAALTIGSNLDSGQEVQLGNVNADTRVLGDLFVDGSSTVTVDETVTGTFNANGNVNLGNNSGDTINLGGGTSDTVNLDTDLVLGAGIVGIGSSVTDYLNDLWLVAVNDNGPDAVAYGLNASGTNAGAYSIGVDPSLIANSTATDLMTMLDDIDNAVSAGGGETLQQTYALGNTIDVTSANGVIDFANDTNSDTTTVLSITRAPGSSTGGLGLDVDLGTNTTGTAVQINQQGSGAALDVQDGGSSVLLVDGAGAVDITPTSGQDLTLTAAGAGTIPISAAGAITLDSSGAGISVDAAGASNFSTSSGNLTLDAAAGELVFDDTGNSGLTLSQSSDRTLAQTGTGEILNGTTSIIGAINALATAIDDDPALTKVLPIEDSVTITADDVVAVSTVSGRVTQANLNNDTASQVLGIALNTGTGDAGGTVDCRVALEGSTVVAGSGFTVGNAVFAPDGTGAPTATAPANTGDVVMRIGWALTSTSFVVSFGPQVVL